MVSNDDEGRRPLKLYRLYHICEGGGIETVSIVEAAEHADAIGRAEEQLQTSSGELWLEEVMVSAVRRRD